MQASDILALLDGGLTSSTGLVVLVSGIASDSHGCEAANDDTKNGGAILSSQGIANTSTGRLQVGALPTLTENVAENKNTIS